MRKGGYMYKKVLIGLISSLFLFSLPVKALSVLSDGLVDFAPNKSETEEVQEVQETSVHSEERRGRGLRSRLHNQELYTRKLRKEVTAWQDSTEKTQERFCRNLKSK